MTLWTALIAAGGAFLGVVVAQLWTSTRERRLWNREDQHRFTEHKRDLYAEVIGDMDRWRRALNKLQTDMTLEQPWEPTDWIDWTHSSSLGNNSRRNIGVLLGRVRLVSADLWSSAQAHAHMLDVATSLIAFEQPLPKKLSWEKIDASLDALTDRMRTDLGIKDAH